jgi:hypothetical protein
MKTNAEVVSDFLQALRAGDGTVDRIELDLCIDALDALASDMEDQYERLEEEIIRADEAETDRDLQTERADDFEVEAESLQERLDESVDTLTTRLRAWRDLFSDWQAAPAGPDGDGRRDGIIEAMGTEYDRTNDALDSI